MPVNKMVNWSFILLAVFAIAGCGFSYPTQSPTMVPAPSNEDLTAIPPRNVESDEAKVERNLYLLAQPFTPVYTENPLTSTPTSAASSTTIDWDAFLRKVEEEDKKLPTWEEELKLLKELLGPVNRHALKYQQMHQTWGLKGMSPEAYRMMVLIPYMREIEPENNWTLDTIPRGLGKRLIVVKEGSPDDKRLMSARDYAKLCDDPLSQESRNCNYFTRMCELTCLYQIWYPDYAYQPDQFTKCIVFDEFKHYVHNNIVKVFGPTKRPPTWVDPDFYNDDEVDDGMSGDVQILHR